MRRPRPTPRTHRWLLPALLVPPLAGLGCDRSGGDAAAPDDAGAEASLPSGNGDGDGGDAGPCRGASCVVRVTGPVTLGRATGAGIYNVSLAAGRDGSIVAAQWNDYDEISGADRPFVATSVDGGSTFGAALRPEQSGTFAYAHVAVTDAGRVLVGGMQYRYPDPLPPGWYDGQWAGWMALHVSDDRGASFAPLADLRGVAAEAYIEQTAMAASDDGQDVLFAWVDQSPADPDAGAGGWAGARLYAALSHDGGATFLSPQVVSTAPAAGAVRVQAFFRQGRAGLAFVESFAPASAGGKPLPDGIMVGAAAVALTGADDRFGPPVRVHGDDVGIVSTDVGVGVGRDGTVHVAWWSGRGVAYTASSADAVRFGEPRVLLRPEAFDPKGIEVAVDGAGTAWFGVVDGGRLRVLRASPDSTPLDVPEAAVDLAITDEEFDVAALPGGGALVLHASPAAGPVGDAGPPATEVRLTRLTLGASASD